MRFELLRVAILAVIWVAAGCSGDDPGAVAEDAAVASDASNGSGVGQNSDENEFIVVEKSF